MRLWQTQTDQCQILIQDCGPVRSLAWKEIFGDHYLVTGSMDKSVRRWKINKEGEEYKMYLCWSTAHSLLTVRGTLIGDVEGLSEIDEKLLKQRGARLCQTAR
ncbi:hypothetical protein [Mycoavidus sp. SF9855]|uniref:hypothetical protein n=1 Tax=Mycoavidus sp. SF9855 TaxID=2968475 RepID=UPI00211C2BD7|nr:hypothetical protein [Mycoavidus sp. SF9855]UUM20727.1 hypothetical protein NQD60_04360 [Mycoavidus sp. SF9855]